jgi:Holliday junction DNA helicase RuvB
VRLERAFQAWLADERGCRQAVAGKLKAKLVSDGTIERIVSPTTGADEGEDLSLRPRRLREVIGQDRLKSNLQILIDAARARGECVDHVLLHGPPGLGKTMLAHVVANEMEGDIRVTSGPAIERPGDLAAILTNLNKSDVLFIDEIHRLNRAVEEVLYPAMEDFVLDIVIGKGPSARSMRIPLPRFTLIGATTRVALLTKPLRDRFGVSYRLELYEQAATEAIVVRSARILKVPVEPAGAAEIARRCRGTPRIANRLLRRVRDYAQVRADGVITQAVAQEALAHLEIDELGLDQVDRRILRAIFEKYGGGPVGLRTLATTVGEEDETIEDVYEPYLLQLGFISITSQGRVATPLAAQHIGVEFKNGGLQQGKLF